MSTTYQEERRRYYRLQPAVEPEPQATFELNGTAFEVKVVNLSPGGLLCYVNGKSAGCTADTLIPKIVIKVPDKKPVIYSGKIVRMMPTAESGKRFCAVEFIQFEKRILQRGSKPCEEFTPENSDDNFILRLGSYKSFLKASSLEVELSLRKAVYDDFMVESQKLAIEERWFFYEIIDEMKRFEPKYPEGLKTEFLRLCRGEDRTEFVPVTKDTKGFMNFLRRLKGLDNI